MHNVAPALNQVRRGRTLRLAFLSAVVSLAAAFAAVAAPIPLFNTYRAEDGFTNSDISLAVVAYGLSTLAARLVLGRLSNHLGRRPTSIASLGLLVLGCLLLLNVHDVGTLLAGRVMMGLGAGLASSNVTAYIVDAAPARPIWLASVASSQTPMIGLAVGAIASGALVQLGPWPRHLIYLVAVGLLVLSAVLIAISPETVTPTPGAWRSLRPSVRVPARARHLLPVVGRGVPGHVGDRGLLPKPSCLHWSKSNSTPAARSSSDWCSPPRWQPALWALPSAAGSHQRRPNAWA
jgi:MFS family permease